MFPYDSAPTKGIRRGSQTQKLYPGRRSLRIAQPSVSLLIKGLERELKVQLFEKLGNRILITSAGERLLQRAQEILAKMEGI